MSSKYVDLQQLIVKKYAIQLVEDSKCKSRTHAHCDGTRRICKFTIKNSVISLFTLCHEVGHIMTYKTKMRRCESEFYATVWAMQELDKLNVVIPINILDDYQQYIYREMDRGLRRGGTYYFSRDDLNIYNYKYITLNTNKVKDPIPVKKKIHRVLLG